MNAIRAKSAKARATIARNIYVRNKTGNFGRSLDNCFEMNDGDEVARLLAERVKWDEEFRRATLRHWRHSIVAVLSVILGRDANKMTQEEMAAAVNAYNAKGPPRPPAALDPAVAAHAPGGIRETIHGMFG